MATAKKPAAKKAPVKKETTVETPEVSFETATEMPPLPKKPSWEYKDRLYELTVGGLATSMGLKIIDVVDKDEDQSNKHKCEQKQQRKNVITSASVK